MPILALSLPTAPAVLLTLTYTLMLTLMILLPMTPALTRIMTGSLPRDTKRKENALVLEAELAGLQAQIEASCRLSEATQSKHAALDAEAEELVAGFQPLQGGPPRTNLVNLS